MSSTPREDRRGVDEKGEKVVVVVVVVVVVMVVVTNCIFMGSKTI